MTAFDDPQRVARLSAALAEARLDAFACTLPNDVLLLTGYWPVVGTSVAIATRDGVVALFHPSDEEDEAARSRAELRRPFESGSLEDLLAAPARLAPALAATLDRLGLSRARIGIEEGPSHVPVPYVSLFLYGRSLREALRAQMPGVRWVRADDVLERLRCRLTPREVDRVRAACALAGDAFRAGAAALRPGMTEVEAARAFRDAFSPPDGTRADGYAACLSGENGARAFGAYARSRGRRLAKGDLALVHANSQRDGFFTDVTRTFVLGPPDAKKAAWFEAVFEARAAALAAIRSGARAAEVDAAARGVFRARRLARLFRHPTGHGVGFAAIDHLAPPRLHPKSPDVLETGMVFNVEPALYDAGVGGLRHCDVVALTENGAEVLTDFLATAGELVAPGR